MKNILFNNKSSLISKLIDDVNIKFEKLLKAQFNNEVIKSELENYLEAVKGLHNQLNLTDKKIWSELIMQVSNGSCETDGWYVPQSCMENPHCNVYKKKRLFRRGELFPRNEHWIHLPY